MTKQDKELLLKDLCGRLPYGVKITWNEEHWVTVTPSMYMFICEEQEFTWKPYLRPMSSMTEDEEKEICQFMKDYNLLPGPNKAGVFCGEITDWLNVHHFDYRGLIETGLALEAPEGMY